MPPPASIAVLVNRRARTAARDLSIVDDVLARFGAAGRAADVIALSDGENPTDAARDAAARASIVVAGGGDGTVNSVAAAVVDSTAALGVLPLGTLNHFARDLHIPNDLGQAVAVIGAEHIVSVDAGMVNGHLFVNNSSIGIYPNIVDVREGLRREGHAKWPAMAIATARVIRRYRGVTVTIDVGGRRRHWRTPFVFVGNNEYAIDGRQMGKRARLDAGQLFVYLAPRLRAYQLPLLLAKALVGRARHSGDFEIVPATELWIGLRRRHRLRVAIDGEIRVMETPLHYQMRAGALRVVVPQG